MKANTKRKVLSFVIMLALLFTMSSFMAISSFAYSANDYTVDSDRIQNEYLHLNYGGGHLYYYTARGENLLFPGTSAFYLNIDGRMYGDDYGHSQYVHKVSTDGLSMFSEISMGGVSVDRYITFALNTQTGRYDVAEFKYVITNDSDSTKSIGSRIMFDTMLGNNDHAPFKVNGQNVTTRTEFVGDAVPQS